MERKNDLPLGIQGMSLTSSDVDTKTKHQETSKLSMYLCTSSNAPESDEPVELSIQSPQTLSPMEEDFQDTTEFPEGTQPNYEMLKSVRAANINLEQHVGILRKRNDAIETLYAEEKEKLQVSEGRRLKQEEEIGELTGSLSARDERIRVLAQQKEEQDRQISENEKTISELEQAVQKAESTKMELSKQFEDLQKANDRLNSGETHNKDQSDVRNELKHELEVAKEKLELMQTELLRAKDIIQKHNEQIQSLEKRVDETTKFKADLEKASRAMTDETNRIKDVMNQQNKEIRSLRLELRDCMQKQNSKMEVIQKQNHDILKQSQNIQAQHMEEMRLLRTHNDYMCRMMMDMQNSASVNRLADFRNISSSEPLSVVKLNITGNRRKIQNFSNINNSRERQNSPNSNSRRPMTTASIRNKRKS